MTMKTMLRRFVFVVSLFALVIIATSCAHVNSVSLTPIPTKRSNMVRAEASKTIFLFFNFENDFVNVMVEDLKRQCPNGVVSGILTKDETIAYVLVFVRKVTATGYCNTTVAKNSDNSKRTPSSEIQTVEEGIE